MLFKLGDMEDIVYILEPAPKVQSVGCLHYILHRPQRSYKPSSDLLSTCQMNGLQRE